MTNFDQVYWIGFSYIITFLTGYLVGKGIIKYYKD